MKTYSVPCSAGFRPFGSLFAAVRYARLLASITGNGAVYFASSKVAEYRTPKSFAGRPALFRRAARA